MGLGTQCCKQLSARSARRRTLLADQPPSGRSPAHPRAPLRATTTGGPQSGRLSPHTATLSGRHEQLLVTGLEPHDPPQPLPGASQVDCGRSSPQPPTAARRNATGCSTQRVCIDRGVGALGCSGGCTWGGTRRYLHLDPAPHLRSAPPAERCLRTTYPVRSGARHATPFSPQSQCIL